MPGTRPSSCAVSKTVVGHRYGFRVAGPWLTELAAAVARATGLLECYSYSTSSIDDLVVYTVRRRLCRPNLLQYKIL